MMERKFKFFWSGPYSQWHYCSFLEDGIRFSSAEQYMMYHKAKLMGDNLSAVKILNERSPKRQKELGRAISDFDPVKWDQHKIGIVYRGNILKFSQNTDLLKQMISEGDVVFVEASPFDKIWGIGLNEGDAEMTDPTEWPGQNLLGKVLTEVRKTLMTFNNIT